MRPLKAAQSNMWPSGTGVESIMCKTAFASLRCLRPRPPISLPSSSLKLYKPLELHQFCPRMTVETQRKENESFESLVYVPRTVVLSNVSVIK